MTAIVVYCAVEFSCTNFHLVYLSICNSLITLIYKFTTLVFFNAEQNTLVMPFHTCGPNEAMVVSGKLLFFFVLGLLTTVSM